MALKTDISVALRIAWRYLFSKKSHSAINNITIISVCGIMVSTAAMVCVLSVFNGFQSLVADQFSDFDPDYKIVSSTGKYFDLDIPSITHLCSIPEIEAHARVIEDNALLISNDRQQVVRVKGVSDEYPLVAPMCDITYSGEFSLWKGSAPQANVGVTLALFMNLSPEFIYPFTLYAPRKDENASITNLAASFRSIQLYTASTFGVAQPEYDEHLLIIPYSEAETLFEREGYATALDIKTNSNNSKTQQKIENILGPDFTVLNRYEQQKELFRMMQIEKWMTFAILCLILTVASLSLLSSITMLILEKRDDSLTLSSFGATRNLRTFVFVFEGWFITLIGTVVGTFIGIGLCLLQKQFGLLQLGEGFLVNSYPVILQTQDILLILLISLSVGFLTSLTPSLFFRIKMNNK